MQLELNFDQPVEKVIKAERDSMTPQQKVYQFAYWAQLNREAISAMYRRAVDHAARVHYVSADYLFHWLRMDSRLHIEGFEDDFKAPDTFSTIFARYLAKHDPRVAECMKFGTSQYDNCYFPPIDWS